MRDVYDFARFFIKNGADSKPNTYDGNMKLQKLLATMHEDYQSITYSLMKLESVECLAMPYYAQIHCMGYLETRDMRILQHRIK